MAAFRSPADYHFGAHPHAASSRRKTSPFTPRAETLADMEPNTSAGGTSSPIIEQGRLTSTHTQSLLSPPLFLQPPSHSLISASGSGSGSPAVGDSSLFVHGRTASQSLPSSFFPATRDTVHMTLDHVSNCLRPQAATPSAAPLGGQPWPGLAPPSRAALGLSACHSQGTFSFFADQSATLLEQIMAWPQSEISFTPASSSGLPPRSSGDNYFGFPQSASGSELAPLPPSLRIPSLEEASTHNMVSTMGRAMPCHRGDLSMNLGSSISSVPNLTTRAMKSPMPPLKPPSSQGAGTSSKFISFAARPSLNSEFAPLPASLQAPLLPEKQGPIDATAARRDPDFVSFINNEEYELVDQDNPNARGVSWEHELKPHAIEATRITRSTPYHHGSSSMGIDNSNSTPKLLLPLPPSSLRADASSSRSPDTRVIYTDAEKEIIRKDKNLQELVNTDPKRVKRLLSNRISAAKRKAINDIHTLELELKVETLQSMYNTLFAESQLLQEQCAQLDTQNKEMSMVIQELKRQATLKDAVTETLQAKIQDLNVTVTPKM